MGRTKFLQRQINLPNAMFIEELGRHLAVSSIPELERSLKRDAGFWNVISIREPAVPRPVFLRFAKRVHEEIFEDRENIDPDLPSTPPRKEHLEAIFRFVDAHPSEPILVHCLAGLSRSPAVALTLIIRGLLAQRFELDAQQFLVEKAVNLLLQIRPQARPNALVLQVGLEQFLSPDAARQLAVHLLNHSTLLENRFVKPRLKGDRE
jgi:predicted protein tyrosine phosphatase